jgi:hypothetical protein
MFVVPPRRAAANPESILSVGPAMALTVTKPAILWLWIPGSRILRDPE